MILKKYLTSLKINNFLKGVFKMKRYDEMLNALKQHWNETSQEEIKEEIYGTHASIYKDLYITMGEYVINKILNDYKEIVDIKEKAAAAYWILNHSDEFDLNSVKNEFIYHLALAAGVTEKRKPIKDNPIA